MSTRKYSLAYSPKFRGAHFSEPYVQSIEHMPYYQARRLSDPIYKVLIMELYEEGCLVAADYFTCLVQKEQKLSQKHIIRELVRERPELLKIIFEHVKLAEKAAKLTDGGGMVACLIILHQLLTILEKNTDDFDWLTSDLYALFAKIAERYEDHEKKCEEIKANIFCSYALYAAKNAKLNLSCKYFQKSLELCRGERWLAKKYRVLHGGTTLHDFVAVKFAQVMINCTNALKNTEPSEGLQFIQRAIEAILEVNEDHNLTFLCDTYIIKINLHIELKQYKEAIGFIEQTEERAKNTTGIDFYRLKCELMLLKGVCLRNLENYDDALALFKKSLTVSEEHNLKKLTGTALLNIASLHTSYSTGGEQELMHAYSLAKKIFEQLLDKHNKQRSVYCLARLMVKNMFSNFLRVMRDSDQYCSLLELRKWKYMCEPSWDVKWPEAPTELKKAPIEEGVNLGKRNKGDSKKENLEKDNKEDLNEPKSEENDEEAALKGYDSDVLEKANHEHFEENIIRKAFRIHTESKDNEEPASATSLEQPSKFIEEKMIKDMKNLKNSSRETKKLKALDCLLNLN